MSYQHTKPTKLKNASLIIFYTAVAKEKKDLNFLMSILSPYELLSSINYLIDTTTSKGEYLTMRSELREITLMSHPEIWI